MFYYMSQLSPNLQQSSAFGGIGNNPISRQPGPQDFDLKLEESDLGLTSCRPGPLEHDQQGVKPSWQHELPLQSTRYKPFIYKCPTIWTTPERAQEATLAQANFRKPNREPAREKRHVEVLPPDIAYLFRCQKVT